MLIIIGSENVIMGGDIILNIGESCEGWASHRGCGETSSGFDIELLVGGA